MERKLENSLSIPALIGAEETELQLLPSSIIFYYDSETDPIQIPNEKEVLQLSVKIYFFKRNFEESNKLTSLKKSLTKTFSLQMK